MHPLRFWRSSLIEWSKCLLMTAEEYRSLRLQRRCSADVSDGIVNCGLMENDTRWTRGQGPSVRPSARQNGDLRRHLTLVLLVYLMVYSRCKSSPTCLLGALSQVSSNRRVSVSLTCVEYSTNLLVSTWCP